MSSDNLVRLTMKHLHLHATACSAVETRLQPDVARRTG